MVVGFRCAGAPLALALHRAGVRVIVVDRDPSFSDQPFSTHAIHPYGMLVLDRLGLGDRVRAIAPRNRALRFQVEEHFMQLDLESAGLDSRSPRRSKLDPVLQQAALEAGVEVRERTSVTEVLREDERVTGVRVRDAGREYDLRARWVVGADGRSSTIARLVGAPTYLEGESPNGLYWGYFERTPAFDELYDWGACIHIEGEDARAVFVTDSDLLLMAGGGRRHIVKDWSRDPRAGLRAHLERGTLTAPLLEGSRMIADPVGLLSLRTFMRQCVGPGWALVGDAGLHLDPTPGLGIADAFRDAAALAAAIVEGGERAMMLYWRRRDAESLGLYHFAADMGSADYNNPMTRLIFRHARHSKAVMRRMMESIVRERDPFAVVPVTTMLGWLLRESLAGNFTPWSALGRTLRLGVLANRQRGVLERLRAAGERGAIDCSVPVLPR